MALISRMIVNDGEKVDKSADVPTKRIENGSIDCGLLGNFRFFVDIPEMIRSADAWQN
jgi:hypothetical protein